MLFEFVDIERVRGDLPVFWNLEGSCGGGDRLDEEGASIFDPEMRTARDGGDVCVHICPIPYSQNMTRVTIFIHLLDQGTLGHPPNIQGLL